MYQPTSLTVLTTDNCTARCSHCCMNSGPDRKDKLSYDQIRSSIDQIRQLGPLNTVIFAGGEPTLLGKDLLDSIAYAYSLGLNTRLVTNASWAISEEKADAKLKSLSEAGLRELNISADDFHIPFISFKNVENAWRAAENKGFSSVLITISYGSENTITPDWVAEKLGETAMIASPEASKPKGGKWIKYRRTSNGTNFLINGTYLQKLGRCHEEVEDSQFQVASVDELTGGCPYAAVNPAVSPSNHLLACCGFENVNNAVLDFGNLNDESAADIYAKVGTDLIVQAISYRGPGFLADFIKRHAPHIEWRDTYGSVCEVCEHITQRKEVVNFLIEHQDDLAQEVILSSWGSRKSA